MRNKRIVDSWNKIEPDSAADARMLDAIIARNHAGQSEKNKVSTMNKTLDWKRLAPIAACLVLVVALVGVFGNNAGWFGSKTYTAELGESGTLNFYKNNKIPGEADFAWDENWGEAITRELTAEGNEVLFNNRAFEGFMSFRSTDGAFMHLEARSGNAQINLSANGHAVTDAFIDTSEISNINDVPVSAGYWVSDANSKGIRTIVYAASFEHNGVAVYIEVAGNESDSDAFRSEMGGLVEQLTNTPPDVTAISAEK
jgi:nitrate reductase NapE component